MKNIRKSIDDLRSDAIETQSSHSESSVISQLNILPSTLSKPFTTLKTAEQSNAGSKQTVFNDDIILTKKPGKQDPTDFIDNKCTEESSEKGIYTWS